MNGLSHTNSIPLTLLTCVTLIMAGCASMPVAELNQYTQAFGEVQRVSEAILLDYDQVLRQSRSEVEQAQAGEQTEGPAYAFPDSLVTFSKESGTQVEQDIGVRRQALVVIDRYNQALTQLASNESLQEIRSSTEGFGHAVNRLVESMAVSSIPGADGVISLATSITTQIEKARLRREFETAVKAGEPLVADILSLFMEDANDHYRLCAALYTKRTTLTVSAIVEQVGHVVQLFSSHAPPGEDFMSVEDRASELNEILVPLKGILPDTEYPYVFSAAESSDATPEYTTAIDVEIASRISAAKELVPQYQADVDTVIARGAALEHYRALLNAAKAGIRVLRKALDTPQSLDASVEEMLSLSFKVKRDIETIRAASMTAR
jgi:hypothetical protein